MSSDTKTSPQNDASSEHEAACGMHASLAQLALDTGASVLQHHKPISQICAYLCAFHSYSSDPQRNVLAHHFCSRVSAEMHQCLIYDSNEKNAKLIGLEYLISERLFRTLPEDEKKYWHSHQYEVASGMLVAPGLPIAAESAFVQEVAHMYGKIIHTWQIDRDPLPLGPPQLMTSVTAASAHVLKAEDWAAKDKLTGCSSGERAEARKSLEYKPRPEGVDQWEQSGQGVNFKPELVAISKDAIKLEAAKAISE